MFFFNFENDKTSGNGNQQPKKTAAYRRRKIKELSGNIGEWSELYASLKIAVDGFLQGVDVDLSPLQGRKLKVLQVVRSDFIIDTGATVTIHKNKDGLIQSKHFKDDDYSFREPVERFAIRTKNLLNKIKELKKNKSNPYADKDVKELLKKLGCTYLSATSASKKDSLVKMIDPKAGGETDYGFSVKSYLGSPPTLMNSSGATSVSFEIQVGNKDQLVEKLSDVLKDKQHSKYKIAYSTLLKSGAELVFNAFDSNAFKKNLMQLDDGLPLIYAYVLQEFERQGSGALDDIFKAIEKSDPLKYGRDCIHFYRRKFKKFLVASALGMRPDTLWDDIDDATGGFIMVQKNGDIAAFYITDRCKFEQYLMENVELQHPTSIRKTKGGKIKNPNKVWLLEKVSKGKEEKLLVHFNAQVRFVV